MSSCFILEEIKRWISIETHWMMIQMLLLLLKQLFCEGLTVFQQLQYIMGFIFSYSIKKFKDESKAVFSSNMQSTEYSQLLSCYLQSAHLHSKLFPLMSQTCSGKHNGTVLFILMGLKKVKDEHVLPNHQMQHSADVLQMASWNFWHYWFFSVLPLFTVFILLHQIVIWYMEKIFVHAFPELVLQLFKVLQVHWSLPKQYENRVRDCMPKPSVPWKMC